MGSTYSWDWLNGKSVRQWPGRPRSVIQRLKKWYLTPPC